jgi:hypothetical protein
MAAVAAALPGEGVVWLDLGTRREASSLLKSRSPGSGGSRGFCDSTGKGSGFLSIGRMQRKLSPSMWQKGRGASGSSAPPGVGVTELVGRTAGLFLILELPRHPLKAEIRREAHAFSHATPSLRSGTCSPRFEPCARMPPPKSTTSSGLWTCTRPATASIRTGLHCPRSSRAYSESSRQRRSAGQPGPKARRRVGRAPRSGRRLGS